MNAALLHLCNTNWMYGYVAAKHDFTKFIQHESPMLLKSIGKLVDSLDLPLPQLCKSSSKPSLFRLASDVFVRKNSENGGRSTKSDV